MNEPFHNECTSLDDYLDRELAGEESLRFETHLANCPACRDAVAQQRWIDAALRSSVATNPVAPATLRTAMSDSIAAATRNQRKRRLLAASFAVAASIAVVATVAWHALPSKISQSRPFSSGSLPLAGATSTVASGERAQAVAGAQHRAGEGEEAWYPPPSPLPNPPYQGEGTSNSAVASSGHANPVAQFIAGGNGIAIPIASDSPEVTIVQFYSTTDADRRMQRQRELEAKYQELIGG